MADRYEKGLNVIRAAAEEALRDRGVAGAQVTCASRLGGAADVVLSIAVDGSAHEATFTHSEVEDSGDAIDAPAAFKVRLLVSQFVR